MLTSAKFWNIKLIFKNCLMCNIYAENLMRISCLIIENHSDSKFCHVIKTAAAIALTEYNVQPTAGLNLNFINNT